MPFIFPFHELYWKKMHLVLIHCFLGLNRSIDCLLSKPPQEEKESPCQPSVAFIAIFGLVVRFGTRIKGLWETFRSLALLIGKNERTARQHFNRYLEVHCPNKKPSNVELIGDAITNGQFEDLENQRIRLWIKEKCKDHPEEYSYSEIIVLCKTCELKLVVAELYFFYQDIIQRLYLSHKTEVERHRGRVVRWDLLTQALAVTKYPSDHSND